MVVRKSNWIYPIKDCRFSIEGPINVFWVVGDSSENSVLVTDYLTTNQYKGDRLRRVFPLSPFDYSIELSVNRTSPERVYSCVIDGASEAETTLFTYIVRTIGKSILSLPLSLFNWIYDLWIYLELEAVEHKASHSEEKIAAHDVLNHDQIHSLRENQKGKNE